MLSIEEDMELILLELEVGASVGKYWMKEGRELVW